VPILCAAGIHSWSMWNRHYIPRMHVRYGHNADLSYMSDLTMEIRRCTRKGCKASQSRHPKKVS